VPTGAPFTAVAPPIRVHDTPSDSIVEWDSTSARFYVCGITPYDSTHLGHAATYVAFDLLNRALRNAGLEVTYVQNVTDVDDPLLERAWAQSVDWRELASEQTERYRSDMEALNVLPPDRFVTVEESMSDIVATIERLESQGRTYRLGSDTYFLIGSDQTPGSSSELPAPEVAELFAERGGDPHRPGKRHPLDPLVWRGWRPGEPSWPSPWGRGRPGWHVGCATIAQEHLGPHIDLQGGGRDLIFPHHEMTAAIAQAIYPDGPFARFFAHAGMVRYGGEKMSKSRGNLVFVSRLREDGVDPAAIRLALLRHHYRSTWDWRDSDLREAEQMVSEWRRAFAASAGAPAGPVRSAVLAALAEDLDAPSALQIVQEWVDMTNGVGGHAIRKDRDAPEQVRLLVDAALGLSLPKSTGSA